MVVFVNRWEAEVLREFLGGKLPPGYEVLPETFAPGAVVTVYPETLERCAAAARAINHR